MGTRVTIVATAVAAMTLGCSQQPSGTATVIEDKTYAVTPASVKDQAVRLITRKIQHIDTQGQPIRLVEGRTEPLIKFAVMGVAVRNATTDEPSC